MTRTRITWAVPPDGYEVPSRRFAATLRSRPAEWAIYPGRYAPGSAASVARYIRLGRWAPGAGYEAVTREGKVYVRYVPREGQ